MSLPSAEMEEIYREAIADHAKRPRNFREMPEAQHHADGHNRVCGDKLTVWVKISNGIIEDVSFMGSGCSISTSSASMMTEAMKGKSLAEAKSLFEKFHVLLTAPIDADVDAANLEKLAAFAGVRRFPIRVKCATLPWHTLRAALDGGDTSVSTEPPV